MFPQGLLSQAYFMCAMVGGGFLIFNFAMGQLDEGAQDGGGHGDHDGGGHDGGGHDGGDHGHGHDGDGHGDQGSTTNRYGPVGLDHRAGKLILSLLSPMSIAIFLAFFGLAGYAAGYVLPWLGFVTLIPAFLAGFLMINIFKAAIRSMMHYGTSSSHMRHEEIIGHVAEVLIPIAENRAGEVTFVIQSKIYNSAARSKLGIAINKGTKVMIVETDGPTVFVEPYKELAFDD
ncbi:MAG: NfeD family protein [Candidatus Obscuribacterales bacterium]|nr:NfeD family protein [Candidatus Obscuribacterales bacterium]